jgi:hypothetical protein
MAGWSPITWVRKLSPASTATVQTILSRLVTRFGLADIPDQVNPSALMAFVKSIQPVTNVDQLLLVPKVVVPAAFNVTAVGTIIIDTVPTNKRRHYHTLRAQLTTGTFTMQAFQIGDGANVALLKFLTSAADIQYGNLDKDFIAEAGWQVSVYVDAKTLNGTMTVTLVYDEEDAF